MRTHQLLICLAAFCIFSVENVHGKTVFRRTDKISENFKQLDLPEEEIDPNVAPLEPQKVETLDPEDVIPEASAAAAATSEIIDESVNEIADSAAASGTELAATANAATAGSTSTSAAAPAAAAPATVTAAAAAVATTAKPVKNEDDKNPISKYCKCTDSHCDCCRNFGLPLIPVRGPGCAKISYLGNDEMSVSIKYGDITLASRRISAKKARPICVGLPGGYSKFCGRVYGLSRAKENFKACLAFELRAEDEVEAALRVSCFKFGPEGLRVAEAEPLPTEVNKEEDDDDDDIFGFAAGGGDDDDDEDEDEDDDYNDADTDADTDDTDDADDYEDDDDAEAPEDADYGGFSLGGLLEELDDDEDVKPAKPTASTPIAAAAAADQTRDATAAAAAQTTQSVTDLAQSKDDAGTVIAAAAAAAAPAATDVVADAVSAVTPAPLAAATESTTAKSKKSKKSKKNKKKKAAADTAESDFAYEIFNGILDFFN